MRPLLHGSTCVRLASVFDPLSARMAAELGFEGCILAGSVASLAVLGAPDLILVTLTELAEQVRRITRADPPPLVVDADHGFGNALSAARTVQELAAAGAAAVTIEDSALPEAFGSGAADVVGVDEAVGKLRAAAEAKAGTDTVVIARTSAYGVEGLTATLERVRRYAEAGADAIFVVGLQRLEEVAAVQDAAGGLPQMLYATGPDIATGDLAPLGVRLLVEGHLPMVAAVEGAWEALSAQRDRGAYQPRHPGLISRLTRADDFERRTTRFLRPDGTDHD
ncbi:oxaloacetate decarboxylase [Blastococcus sp. URHD0036]|uniref:isocitrate lyase/PEP mutase family protein n=1 Tax=Blastococcus sp. URHD0036 TaxID=1380356 RepID=UPI00068D16E5|nr:isocitrate lyase/phosphoenolpyruvate mutase family protein [Blastococcus sp. URHD0036]